MKAELLFVAAFDRVSATQATHEYLWDKAVAFADAFDGAENDPRFPIYSRLFCFGFRPGWDDTPQRLLADATELSVQAIDALKVCKANSPERLESDAQAEADAEARKAAIIADRAAFVAKKKAEAEAKAAAEASATALLEPETLEAVKVADLDIHGLAKNAYKKAGLETVGEVLTYKAARPLEDINGISDKFELQTLEAIDALRPKFAKPETTADAPAE